LIAAGVPAGATSAMLSSLIWLTTVVGDLFTLQDLPGATFLHLLLGPVVAMILGIAAAGLGKVIRPNKGHRPAAALD
jgi:hypothetical protein